LKTQPKSKLSTSEVTSGIQNFWLQKSETVLHPNSCLFFCFFPFFGFGFSFVFPQISSGYFEYEFCEHLGLSSCLIVLMQADLLLL
jgi:hypothetical protein